MAYGFVGSSNQYLSAAAPASAAPLTVSAWFRVDTASGNKAIVSLGTGNDAHRFVLYNGGLSLFWFVNSTTFSQAQAPGTVTANTWHHACAVETSSTNRVVYLNGSVSSTQTGAITPLNVDELNIGGDRANNALGNQMTGQIADVGIWSASLTAAEVTSLSRGVACRMVRPQSLVFYAPLMREIIDVVRAATLTNNNSATVQVHPRIYA